MTDKVHADEYILQPAHREPTGQSKLTQAPEPLLPNYRSGGIRQYNLDLDMMVLANSKERSVDDFIRLVEEAGLTFVKVWVCGEMSATEFRL